MVQKIALTKQRLSNEHIIYTLFEVCSFGHLKFFIHDTDFDLNRHLDYKLSRDFMNIFCYEPRANTKLLEATYYDSPSYTNHKIPSKLEELGEICIDFPLLPNNVIIRYSEG